MIQLVKQFFNLIWNRKKEIFAFILFTSFLFALRFPWTEALEKIVRQSQKQLNADIDFEKVSLKFFPPGIAFHKITVNHSAFKESIDLDHFVFSIHLQEWLAFKKSWKLKGQKDQSSFVFIWRQEKKMVNEVESNYLFLKGKSSHLDFSFLKFLLPRVKIKGRASFELNYEGNIKRLEEAKGFLKISTSQVDWLQSRLETNMGVLELPQLQWSEGNAMIRLKDGNLVTESLNLGSQSDDLYLQLRGNGELNYNYRGLKLGSYDFQIKIDANKSINLSLVDLMLSSTRQETSNRYIYKARISGQNYGAPNIEKLSEF